MILCTVQDGRSPTKHEISEWLKNVGALMRLLKRYRDFKSVEKLNEQRKRLKDILKSMGGEISRSGM